MDSEEFKKRFESIQNDLGVDFMKLYIRYGFNPGTPQECAEAVVRATSLRQVEGWYRDDVFQWGPMFLKHMFPEMTRYIVPWTRVTAKSSES